MVTSPDGVEWQVRVLRVRLPSARQSDYDPTIDGGASLGPYNRGSIGDLLEYAIIGPFMWFVAPLLRVAVVLPFEAARGLASRRRWIEADSQWPKDGMEIVWRAPRSSALAVAEHVAAHLAHGYDGLTHPDAELVHATVPPATPAPKPKIF
jgi:hypothetical protein